MFSLSPGSDELRDFFANSKDGHIRLMKIGIVEGRSHLLSV